MVKYKVLYEEYFKTAFFGKALLTNYACTWNNSLKYCISAEFLLIKGYLQGALQTTTLEKSCWQKLSIPGTIYLSIKFCWLSADSELFTKRSTKGATHCFSLRALQKCYFGKVLLTNCTSTWKHLLKHCISPEFLLIQG